MTLLCGVALISIPATASAFEGSEHALSYGETPNWTVYRQGTSDSCFAHNQNFDTEMIPVRFVNALATPFNRADADLKPRQAHNQAAKCQNL